MGAVFSLGRIASFHLDENGFVDLPASRIGHGTFGSTASRR